jgi:hypothetical protein
MGTGTLPEGKADNLIVVWRSIVYKVWDPGRITNRQASTDRYNESFGLEELRIAHC